MDALRRHEIFEIELLEKLKKRGFLKPLVFSGGTMMRLCYDLNRYSTGLDFWFIRKVRENDYFKKIKEELKLYYQVTDAQIKFNTLLLEIRSKNYPKRLKIEIRKGLAKCDYEERIAFSRYSTQQVILNVHTLEQMMINKIEAASERKDIRDFFDIEFLLRQGVILPAQKKGSLIKLRNIAMSFKDNDFKVALGSVLDPNTRNYYIKNKFDFLLKKTNSATI